MFRIFCLIIVLFSSSVIAKPTQWYAISNASGKCEIIDAPDKIVSAAKRLGIPVSRQRNEFSTGIVMESIMINDTLLVLFSSKDYCKRTLSELK